MGRTSSMPSRSATRADGGLVAWGSEHTCSKPTVLNASSRGGGGTLGCVPLTPGRRREPPSDLDGRQYLGEERRHRQAHVAEQPAVLGAPRAAQSPNPSSSHASICRSRNAFVSGRVKARPYGRFPDLDMGEHGGELVEVASIEAP